MKYGKLPALLLAALCLLLIFPGCEAAGVNRSTFYLHYETLSDLLAESAQYLNERFLAHMEHDARTFVSRLHDCPLEELYLVTPEYLTPYLRAT